jgi:flagellar export protein FliJ
MRPFRFRLEKVLSWREAQLAMEEADLERLRSDLHSIEAAIDALTLRDQAATERMRRMRSAQGSEIADIARYHDWVLREEKTLRSRVAECGVQIEKRTEAVTEARRKVELLERMKERRRHSWDAETDRELEQLAGESAIGAWRREKGHAS